MKVQKKVLGKLAGGRLKAEMSWKMEKKVQRSPSGWAVISGGPQEEQMVQKNSEDPNCLVKMRTLLFWGLIVNTECQYLVSDKSYCIKIIPHATSGSTHRDLGNMPSHPSMWWLYPTRNPCPFAWPLPRGSLLVSRHPWILQLSKHLNVFRSQIQSSAKAQIKLNNLKFPESSLLS